MQRGEDVNVEKELGTGNEEMEREWKEVLREIEGEEVLFQSRKVRKALREEGKSGEKAVNGKGGEKEVEVVKKDDGTVRVESVEGVKFY